MFSPGFHVSGTGFNAVLMAFLHFLKNSGVNQKKSITNRDLLELQSWINKSRLFYSVLASS